MGFTGVPSIRTLGSSEASTSHSAHDPNMLVTPRERNPAKQKDSHDNDMTLVTCTISVLLNGPTPLSTLAS
jgi:hypothetical protein